MKLYLYGKVTIEEDNKWGDTPQPDRQRRYANGIRKKDPKVSNRYVGFLVRQKFGMRFVENWW